MPRVSKEAKAASHEKIIAAAARLFREKGIGATSVADVMKAAGLTHGGFYRHFRSKDDLAAAAIAHAFEDIARMLETAMRQNTGHAALAIYIERYLSERHAADPGSGCPIAAIGAEAARAPAAERAAFARGSERVMGLIAAAIGGNGQEASARASGLMALLAGTIVLARTTRSDRARRDILAAGRRLALQSLKD